MTLFDEVWKMPVQIKFLPPEKMSPLFPGLARTYTDNRQPQRAYDTLLADRNLLALKVVRLRKMLKDMGVSDTDVKYKELGVTLVPPPPDVALAESDMVTPDA